MYETDIEASFRWFQMAADNGSILAQLKLIEINDNN